jgi:hypothetical protein
MKDRGPKGWPGKLGVLDELQIISSKRLTTVRRFAWLCFLLGPPGVLNVVDFSLQSQTSLLSRRSISLTEVSFVASLNTQRTSVAAARLHAQESIVHCSSSSCRQRLLAAAVLLDEPSRCFAGNSRTHLQCSAAPVESPSSTETPPYRSRAG